MRYIIKDYKNLNRRELHKIFAMDISEFIFDLKGSPSVREREAAMIIEDRKMAILKHFPRVLYPSNVNTPDFASCKDLIILEVKSVEGFKNGFNNAFKRAKKQFEKLNCDFQKIVALNVDKIIDEYDDAEIIEKARERARAHNAKSFVVIKNGECVFSRLE